MGRSAIRFITLVLLLALAACATPSVYPRGPTIAVPHIEDRTDFVMSDGARLPLREWVPGDAVQAGAAPKAILIAVHGMNDYSNAFAMPASYLSQFGILTYAYDQRGFGAAPHRGRWPGTATLISDLDDVAFAVRARHPDVPIYLMGVSMGGAVILAAAGVHKLPPAAGVILAAPAVWGWQAMNIAYKIVLWTGAHVMPGKTLTGERLEIWPSDNIAMLRAFAADPEVIKATRIGTIYGLVTLMDRGYEGADDLDVPTLLLYGKKDEIVPKAPVMDVAKRIPGPLRFIYYDNGYHMLERDLQAKNVWNDIKAWIGDREAPLPSVSGSHPVATELRLGRGAIAAGAAVPASAAP